MIHLAYSVEFAEIFRRLCCQFGLDIRCSLLTVTDFYRKILNYIRNIYIRFEMQRIRGVLAVLALASFAQAKVLSGVIKLDGEVPEHYISKVGSQHNVHQSAPTMEQHVYLIFSFNFSLWPCHSLCGHVVDSTAAL